LTQIKQEIKLTKIVLFHVLATSCFMWTGHSDHWTAWFV